ncbi:MAG: DUF4339 domain-containing protein [Thermoguttaceae bacterium]|nr:DUF4339 domain-containing protein [Thermoguttaceae bacterium]MDO4856948.1 DUF4339 domain-containing protein [Thermoguttaceae bacterium]
MGIRFYCPNGHKLNVKEFQAGQRGICPKCHARFDIPFSSTREAGSKDLPIAKEWEKKAREQGLFPYDKKETKPSLDDINLNALPTDFDMVPGFLEANDAGHSGIITTEAMIKAASFEPQTAPEPAAPKLPDPFEGPADIVWYVRPASGEQLGPVDRDVIKRWLSENRIAPDTLVWREGWADWKNAGDVFEQLASRKNVFGF